MRRKQKLVECKNVVAIGRRTLRIGQKCAEMLAGARKVKRIGWSKEAVLPFWMVVQSST